MLIGSRYVRRSISLPRVAGPDEAAIQGGYAMATVVDPVCNMQIESGEAEGRAEFEGVVYYFCSADCRDKFMANPQRYVNTD